MPRRYKSKKRRSHTKKRSHKRKDHSKKRSYQRKNKKGGAPAPAVDLAEMGAGAGLTSENVTGLSLARPDPICFRRGDGMWLNPNPNLPVMTVPTWHPQAGVIEGRVQQIEGGEPQPAGQSGERAPDAAAELRGFDIVPESEPTPHYTFQELHPPGSRAYWEGVRAGCAPSRPTGNPTQAPVLAPLWDDDEEQILWDYIMSRGGEKLKWKGNKPLLKALPRRKYDAIRQHNTEEYRQRMMDKYGRKKRK